MALDATIPAREHSFGHIVRNLRGLLPV